MKIQKLITSTACLGIVLPSYRKLNLLKNLFTGFLSLVALMVLVLFLGNDK